MNLSDIKGIGNKRMELLKQMGIDSLESALCCYPTDYIDASALTPVSELYEGQRATVMVEAVADPAVFYKGKLSVLTLRCQDNSGKLVLRWFNQPYRAQSLHKGMVLFASGKVARERGLSITNPMLTTDPNSITPIYTTVKGISQSVLKSIIDTALWNVPIAETLPLELINEFSLMCRSEAIRQLHRPLSTELLQQARERLSFERTLSYLLAVEHQKQSRRLNGISFDTHGLIDKFISRLPFEPTKAQRRVMQEVGADMASAAVMNRLIQGDVGSGKTVIAQFALAVAAANGYQAVFMVPTEILARQHYQTLRGMFCDTCCLLLGSMSQRERNAVIEGISSHHYSIVIGTHAVLNEQVKFDKLGLIITDEQHRFGVAQRARLANKGFRPDTLVMSATPIPRTLALMLYGDLELSVIDELPKGRLPIKTRYISPNRRKELYKYILEQARLGNQSYVVCPMIEQNDELSAPSAEELYNELSKQMKGVGVGLLHGRLKESQKDELMQAFKAGDIAVLVSTTVIEVGIDVANATNMVIEGANRFGLATLHQLRGRVGRGHKQAYCFLLTNDNKKTQRIEAMLTTQDGFELAQMDLDIRGAGDIFGLRQHGDEPTAFLDCSYDIIARAQQAAKRIIELPTAQNNELWDRCAREYGLDSTVVNN